MIYLKKKNYNTFGLLTVLNFEPSWHYKFFIFSTLLKIAYYK